MSREELAVTRARGVGTIKLTGILVALLSVAGLAFGLLLTRSLGDDLRSSVAVSRSALEAINQTIEAVDLVAANTAASLESASGTVDSASDTIEGAVEAIERSADFLEGGLPETIESIQGTMPAAIQTANAIDDTLSALSFFGVDYDPDAPFGESLSRVNTALASLPAELRAQSESLRLLTPSAEELAGQTDNLAVSMNELTESLAGLTSLTGSYETTIAEAETVIDRTDTSVERSLWLIRAVVVAMAGAGVAVGLGLLVVARSIDALHAEMVDVDSRHEETVEA